MNGFLVLDKPEGMTSHDVVAVVRRTLRMKKVGHTGTLDPFATGVLPVAVGEATKVIPYLDESVKEYRAVMCLGVATDTQDRTGTILHRKPFEQITELMILEAFFRFTGDISQIPPMFSAIKVGGVPLYKRARRGETVERKSRRVTIHSLFMNWFQGPFVTFSVRCSRGTYVRTLASDLGEFLGCGAHLTELRRLRSGPFYEDMAISPDSLEKCSEGNKLSEIFISPLKSLSHLYSLSLTEGGAKEISYGRSPSPDDIENGSLEQIVPGQTVCFIRKGNLLATASRVTPGDDKTFRLLRVFA